MEPILFENGKPFFPFGVGKIEKDDLQLKRRLFFVVAREFVEWHVVLAVLSRISERRSNFNAAWGFSVIIRVTSRLNSISEGLAFSLFARTRFFFLKLDCLLMACLAIRLL